MKYIKLFEDFKNIPYLDPDYYIDDYLGSDAYEYYEEDLENDDSGEIREKILSEIQFFIDNVINLEFPIHIYRGVNTNDKSSSYTYHEDDLGCWSTRKEVAKSFATHQGQGTRGKLFHGILRDNSNVDIEQTIRTNITNSGEYEITVLDSTKVEILDVEFVGDSD